MSHDVPIYYTIEDKNQVFPTLSDGRILLCTAPGCGRSPRYTRGGRRFEHIIAHHQVSCPIFVVWWCPLVHPRRSSVRFRYLLPCGSMGFRLWRVVGAKRIRQFLARPWLSWQWISAAWILIPEPSRDRRLGAVLPVRFPARANSSAEFEVGDGPRPRAFHGNSSYPRGCRAAFPHMRSTHPSCRAI